MEESPIKVTEQEAIDTEGELWPRLFSVETQFDINDFCTDRGMKRTSEDPDDGNPAKSSQNGMAGNSDINDFCTDQGMKRTSEDPDDGNPAKSSRNGMAGNSDPLPLGYHRGTCEECVEVVYKIGHKHGKQKKTNVRNWGLLLYMKRADPEEVRNIEDKVIEYINESAQGTTSQNRTTCFVCGRLSRGHNHNVKDCIQIVDVLLQADGQLRYTKESGRVLNTCVRGFHTHSTYVDQLACAINGDGGFATVEKFRKLESRGATPCP